jgi:hydrogenase/urease accessory protein HupE
MNRAWQRFGVQSACLLLALLLVPCAAPAHESRPAYLAVTETAPGQYSLLWRTPLLAGVRLPVILKLPDRVKNVRQPVISELADSLVEHRWVDLGSNGLAGERIEFIGLQLTITDVLIRAQMLNGTASTALARPNQPWVEIAAEPGILSVAGSYILHGIKHILFGYDHLLFVLALILIVRSRRALLSTITAFTLAHSITLSVATLGVVHVPGRPVEAMIALSILLLACELIRLERGEASMTAQRPWIVAFTFGLLHGFGFASALTEVGLPRGDIPLALFAFNVGVEVGQIMFVTAALALFAIAERFKLPPIVRRGALHATTYGIGAPAGFWFIERMAGFGP